MNAETLAVNSEDLLVFRKEDGLLHLLDTATHLIWQATELGMDAHTIHAAFPIEAKPDVAWIQSLQSQWRRQGLVTAGYPPLPYVLSVKPGLQTIKLCTNYNNLFQHLKAIYRPYLVTDAEAGTTEIEAVWLEDEQVYLIRRNQGVPSIWHRFDDAVLSVGYEITETATHELPRLFVAHAAALKGANCNLLIPAKAGKGKSTLTACLLKQGYQLINDDVVPINMDGSVTALNLPLKIKSGSWNIISNLYPELSAIHSIERQNIYLKYLPIEQMECCLPGSTHHIDWILVPEYAPDQSPCLQSLTPTQGLAALLAAEPFIPHPLTASYLQKIVNWASPLKAFSLRYRNSTEALDLLERAMKEYFDGENHD